MKKQSGYIDKKGDFHKTIYECNNANLSIRMSRLEEKIQDLNISYARKFTREIVKSPGFPWEVPVDTIERIFLSLFVHKREHLIYLDNEIKEIEKEYNAIRFKYSLPKLLRIDWWLPRRTNYKD